MDASHVSPTEFPEFTSSRSLDRYPRLVRRHQRWGWVVSLFLHSFVACAIVILVLRLRPSWAFPVPSSERDAIQVVQLVDSEESITQAGQESPDSIRIVTDVEEVTGRLVSLKIDEMVEEANEKGREENLVELDRLSGRLESMSDENSIDEIADNLQTALGMTPRAFEPANEVAAGRFDVSTAQIHDVERVDNENGYWLYFSILIDANGRTKRVALRTAEGERAFETMRRIKSNPLLEKVYRQIALPLMDQMLSTIQQAETSRAKTERPTDSEATSSEQQSVGEFEAVSGE